MPGWEDAFRDYRQALDQLPSFTLEMVRSAPLADLDFAVGRHIMRLTDPMPWIKPSTNHEQAAWVEEEIERRHLGAVYSDLLLQLVCQDFVEIDMFKIAHASPANRCRAALVAISSSGLQVAQQAVAPGPVSPTCSPILALGFNPDEQEGE